MYLHYIELKVYTQEWTLLKIKSEAKIDLHYPRLRS